MISVCNIADVYMEMNELLHDYYERDSKACRNVPRLDMNWDKFVQLESSGNTLSAESRKDDGKMNGFVLYILYEHPQHRGVMFATCNTLAVHLDHRGKGVAKHLLAFTEPMLRTRGIHTIVHNYRTTYNDARPLFPKLGYKLIELSYAKELV